MMISFFYFCFVSAMLSVVKMQTTDNVDDMSLGVGRLDESQFAFPFRPPEIDKMIRSEDRGDGTVFTYDTTNLGLSRFSMLVSTNTTSSGAIEINKCCPWGTYFDINSLICKWTLHSGQVRNVTVQEMLFMQHLFLSYYVRNFSPLKFYEFREGVPPCPDSQVLISEVTTDFSCDLEGPRVNGNFITDEYCIDGSDSNAAVLLTCRNGAEICKNRPCIRKCKPFGDFFGMEDEGLLELPPLNIKFHNLETLHEDKLMKLPDFGLYLGNTCNGRGRHMLNPDSDPYDSHFLGIDGRLYLPVPEGQYLENEEFCIEYVKVENISDVRVFLCFAEASFSVKHYLLAAGFFISCVSLLATFLVYMFSPKSQNLYGKSLMCYVASLFCAYLSLGVIQVTTDKLGNTACVVAGYSTLFSFLAAFFWLNVMSADIWKTFRSHRSARFNKSSRSKIQFLWYSLYAWSIPCVLTGLCAAADFVPNFVSPSLKPDIGEHVCWFSKSTNGVHLFFIAPISLVIICNTILYINTAWRCWKIKSEILRMGNQSRKKYTANKTQFIINGKLFIVMGVVWSLEVISFFFDHPIWYISDAANALHGVFIFVIFVLKKKVLAGLPERIRSPFIRMKNIKKKSLDETVGIDDTTNMTKRNFSRGSSTNITDVV